MDFSRAFTYSFDDKDWVGKLAILTILTFSSALLMPMLFLGMAPLCILLGYMVDIVRNVRDGQSMILPRWDNYADLFSKGIGVLIALIVYNAPLIVMGFCLLSAGGVFDDDIVSGFFTFLALCCLSPFMLIYAVVAYPMFGAGFIRYSERGKVNDFFEVSKVFGMMSSMGGYTVQWLLMAVGANIALSLIGIIPCLGWIVIGALTIPVQGHLLGQYARLYDSRKGKHKNNAKIIDGH